MALGALTTIEAQDLCDPIFVYVQKHLGAHAISGLDLSQLLRATSRLRGYGELAQMLLWRLIEEHESYSVLDVVSAVHLAVSMWLGRVRGSLEVAWWCCHYIGWPIGQIYNNIILIQHEEV